MAQIDHSLLGAPRSSGILLHPTSLPGRYGVGTLGPEAEQFLDFLAASGQKLWQVLPVGPTGYGDSPYQGFSAFAGNPLLVALEPLQSAGLVEEDELAGWNERESDDPTLVEFRSVVLWKNSLLRKAFVRFRSAAKPSQRASLDRFRNDDAPWVDDYALFMALKQTHEGVAWPEWQSEFRDRDRAALREFADDQAREIDFHTLVQWIFYHQWRRLRAHERTGFEWWHKVLVSRFDLFDYVRVDHFRGFCAYWAIPFGEPTAVHGEWIPAPGEALFRTLEERIGRLPIIAEDLGVITPDVVELPKGRRRRDHDRLVLPLAIRHRYSLRAHCTPLGDRSHAPAATRRREGEDLRVHR